MPGRLGITARLDDGALVIELEPTPEVLHHGVVRASVLAYMIDVVAGVAVDKGDDVWTLTSDLSFRAQALQAPQLLSAVGDVVRSGRRSVTCEVDVTTEEGLLLAAGAVGFAYVPRKPDDPPKRMLTPEEAVAMWEEPPTLDNPLAEEAGVEVLDAAAGIVQIEIVPELLNPAGTLQGAMVALVAEVAAEELAACRLGAPSVVTDMEIRYLGRTSAGPIRSSARPIGNEHDAPIEVRLVDTSTGALTTLVYARAVAAP